MFRVRSWLVLMVTLAALGLGVWVYYGIRTTGEQAETPVVTFASPAPHAALSLLLVNDIQGQREIITCTDGHCRTQPPPASIDGNAVFDGESWYYYQEAVSTTTTLVKRILQRTFVANTATEQIIEDTPLATPRELLISPNGKYLAFFLDNINQPKASLTELWFYDAEKKGVRLLVEKLYRPDMLTPVRWNRSSNVVWFLVDSGPRKDREDKLELITASLTPPAVSAKFSAIPWKDLKTVAESGIMDISPSAAKIAYVRPTLLRGEELVIATPESEVARLSVRGHVVHVQWLEDESVVYAVEDQHGFTVWRVQDSVNRFLARRPGRLLTAQSDVRGEYLALVVKERGSQSQLYSLHIGTGSVIHDGALAAANGDLRLVHVAAQPLPQSAVVAGTTSVLDDAELAAFIDQHFNDISGSTTVRPQALLMTSTPNNLYVDYRRPTGEEERLLVSVNDIVHADWSIKARYVAQQGEWRKINGDGLPGPKPARLYEWEESVGKWILKSSNP